jgi:hypothetical protein
MHGVLVRLRLLAIKVAYEEALGAQQAAMLSITV